MGPSPRRARTHGTGTNMRIKPSAGLLTGGLSAMVGGAVFAGISITDASGVPEHPLWVLGLLISTAGLVMFIVGMFRLGRNVDLAAAKIVDGLEARNPAEQLGSGPIRASRPRRAEATAFCASTAV